LHLPHIRLKTISALTYHNNWLSTHIRLFTNLQYSIPYKEHDCCYGVIEMAQKYLNPTLKLAAHLAACCAALVATPVFADVKAGVDAWSRGEYGREGMACTCVKGGF
jgi:hypothetical protein